MSAVTFIEAPFIPTHRAYSDGEIQVLGIASPVGRPHPMFRQVFFWNKGRELMFLPLEEFVKMLPNGQLRFRPIRDEFDLLMMIQVPPLKGRVDFE